MISLLVAYIYARTIVAPILEIKRVTRRMMDLDAQVRLRVDSKDEIGDLKEQINSLYQHLLTVIADLHDKNEAILQLEKMKVEFLRGASHELKTPLASLKILIENMKENVGRYKDRDHYLGVALGIVDDLSHHVLQILSLSSVQELRDEKEEVDLLQMTQSLVNDYALLAKERELQVDISLTRQQAYINPSVMKLILSNLISNAIKHPLQVAWSASGREKENSLLRIAVVLKNKKNWPSLFLTMLVARPRVREWDSCGQKFIRT